MSDVVAASDKEWFGQPRGLATLFFTEMWERFSYYGMRALLILYMVGSVQQPGLGFGEKRAATIYGLYTTLVYLMGVPGGFIADRFLGHYRAVLIGGIIIALGHFCMAVPGLPFFYSGLGLIILGTGLLKPNVSTIVGTLYAKDDIRRDAGFSIFYMGINLGAFIAPLITGYLGQKINWHFGFAAAGVGMTLGLIQYVAGRKYLVARSEAKNPQTKAIENAVAKKEPLSRADWLRIGAIVILSAFALMFWSGFEQAGSSLTLFADRATRLFVLGFNYPSSWFQSVEPLFVIIFAPIFAWMWIRLGRLQPSSPVKFTLGLALASLSFLLIVPAAHMFEASHQRVSPMWLIGVYFLQMAGELCLSPVGLSLVTKLSPPRLVGLMMGVWFFATALGNYVAGWAAGSLENATFSTLFQSVFIAIGIASVVLILLLWPLRRMMGDIH